MKIMSCRARLSQIRTWPDCIHKLCMLNLSRLKMFCKLCFTSDIVVIVADLLIVVLVIHRQHDWQRSNLPISLYVCMPVLPSLLLISPWFPCKYTARRNYWHFCFAQNKTENSKKQKTEQQQTHTHTRTH